MSGPPNLRVISCNGVTVKERLRETVKKCLEDFDLYAEIEIYTEADDDHFPQDWRGLFIATRHIWTAVLRAGFHPRAVDPTQFVDIVAELDDLEVAPDEFPMLFADAWKKVRWPKELSLPEFACFLALTKGWRPEVGDDWPDDKARQAAEVLCATIVQMAYMAKYSSGNCADPFLSTRVAGELIGTSHNYASVILSTLVAKGILERGERQAGRLAFCYCHKGVVSPKFWEYCEDRFWAG